MKNKYVLFILFLIMVIAQWWIPIRMIWDSERTLATGKEFKFRLAPVDPEDPFRGRYLNLDYDISRFKVITPPHWSVGQKVFVVIEEDSEGFAKIERLSRDRPDQDIDFIESRIRSVYGEDSAMLFIEYPLDRYYINEKMADRIEDQLLEHLRDTTPANYAVVRVRDGGAVLEEIFLDSIPLQEWYLRAVD